MGVRAPTLLEQTAYVLGVLAWLVGIVLAKGFWSTAIAVCVPPWAWYLSVERVLMMWGWI